MPCVELRTLHMRYKKYGVERLVNVTLQPSHGDNRQPSRRLSLVKSKPAASNEPTTVSLTGKRKGQKLYRKRRRSEKDHMPVNPPESQNDTQVRNSLRVQGTTSTRGAIDLQKRHCCYTLQNYTAKSTTAPLSSDFAKIVETEYPESRACTRRYESDAPGIQSV